MALAQERAVTLVQIADQMAFLFVADDEFEIAPSRGRCVEGTDRIGEILEAVIAHVETCDWTVEALALQPVTEALGIKFRKAAPAVYAAVEGVHRGLPAVRLDASARPRTHPRPAPRRSRPSGLTVLLG